MSHKILLIDDDGDDREFFLDAISKVSSQVSCTVLESCMNLIPDLTAGKIERPDLIFLDINIPEMSGWTCLALLKKNALLADIPVIMYSTSNHIEEAMRAKKEGAVSFFTKPYDLKELHEILKEVIEHMDENTLTELHQNSDRFY
ncbi:response regulator receiver domain-containing protein [Flavobacterium chryseum]|uniref:response regulator n=1 Tax=Flavobacterium sp. P3160 TaxID=2512113 RepID=UPI00106141BF|nr:response regulator [Flavobacterium sp. P3160]TDO73149.1 response regulator receiver domain-containing protein [Flavobacterium sp. P3160]